jgi:hypothetical protein
LCALELLIIDCVIVNNVIIAFRVFIGELVYLESAIYVLQNSSEEFYKQLPNKVI